MASSEMKLLYELSGEHPKLPRAELIAVLRGLLEDADKFEFSDLALEKV